MTDSMNTTPVSAPTNGKDWETAIAYVGPLFLITMWKKGDNADSVWHAKNGAGLFAICIAAYLIVVALSYVMPISMLSIITLLALIVKVGTLAASIYGAWNAWSGKQWHIPFVTDFGQKIPLEKLFHHSATPAPATAPATAPAVSPSPIVAPSEPVSVETPTAPAVSPVAPSEPINVVTPTETQTEAPTPMAAEPMPVETPTPEPTPVVEAPTAPAVSPAAPSEPINVVTPEPTPTAAPAAPTEGPTA